MTATPDVVNADYDGLDPRIRTAIEQGVINPHMAEASLAGAWHDREYAAPPASHPLYNENLTDRVLTLTYGEPLQQTLIFPHSPPDAVLEPATPDERAAARALATQCINAVRALRNDKETYHASMPAGDYDARRRRTASRELRRLHGGRAR